MATRNKRSAHTGEFEFALTPRQPVASFDAFDDDEEAQSRRREKRRRRKKEKKLEKPLIEEDGDPDRLLEGSKKTRRRRKKKKLRPELWYDERLDDEENDLETEDGLLKEFDWDDEWDTNRL